MSEATIRNSLTYQLKLVNQKSNEFSMLSVTALLYRRRIWNSQPQFSYDSTHNPVGKESNRRGKSHYFVALILIICDRWLNNSKNPNGGLPRHSFIAKLSEIWIIRSGIYTISFPNQMQSQSVDGYVLVVWYILWGECHCAQFFLGFWSPWIRMLLSQLRER